MTHIKIGDISPKIQYIADGDILTFTFPFAVFKTSDVEVYFDGQMQSSGFSVTLNADCDGGFVVFEEAPKDGVLLTLRRYLIIERTTDFQEGGAFRAKVLNDELDYQTACLQQLSEDLKSSMVLPAYANSSINMTLPLPEAGRAIVWNDEAGGLANSNSVFDNIIPMAEASKIAAEQALAEAIIARDDALNFKTSTETAKALAEQAQLAAEAARDAADDIVNLGDLAYKDTVGTDDIANSFVTAEKLAAGAVTITGTVLAYASSIVPAGWLECNGAELSRTTYANLFAVVGETYGAGDSSTTFNLPDLRGGFIRGFDNGAGVDADRVFGSSQDDALQNIAGTLYLSNASSAGPASAGSSATGAFYLVSDGTHYTYGNSGGAYATVQPAFDASRVARTATETRPANTSMMYIIKY